METPLYISAAFMQQHTDFQKLVKDLKIAFAQSQVTVPLRHHHQVRDQKQENTGEEPTLLLMPAWEAGVDMGVKLVTVHPDNHQLNLPTIQGIYLYQDATNGQIKAMLDAKALTTQRTAAASALASDLLSRPESTSLLQIGTGALAPSLILAHASVRPIKQVYVWGRNVEKAKMVCQQLEGMDFSIQAVDSIEETIPLADIISCATLSKEALISGELLKPGQHIDLVGSFKPDMREADDDTVLSASIFVDDYAGAMSESGDLTIPLEKGIINKNDVLADLHELCSNKHPGRQSPEEITLFKSVGYALEDLVGARYYYNKRDQN